MQKTSYSCPHRVAHAVGWSTRWIVTVVCGLLLALVSAGAAQASPLTTAPAAVTHTADDVASAAADSTTAQGSAVLERGPVHSGTHDPFDSSDAWLDPDDDDRDDDDSSRDDVAGGSHPLSAEELLGLIRASLGSGGSLIPEHTPGNQFLAESARRL
jgi:hypothetical protein